MKFSQVIPILRSFDEGKALEFYVEWLDHGDATPGSAVRIRVDELEALHAEISAKNYKNYRPGLKDQEWASAR